MVHSFLDIYTQVKTTQATQPFLFQNGFILTDLPAADIALLNSSAKPVSRKRGEILFRQGTFPNGVYWLNSGKVKIFQGLEDGQRQTLYIYSDGDLIGHRQFISEEPNPVTAMLLEDSMITFIPGGTFRQLLSASSFFSRNILTALAREFTVWMNRITIFQNSPVRIRLILALLILHEQYRTSGSPPGIVTITRTELAEYVGSTLETVVRIMNSLKTDKLVSVNGRRIVIHNPEFLLDVLKKEEILNKK